MLRDTTLFDAVRLARRVRSSASVNAYPDNGGIRSAYWAGSAERLEGEQSVCFGRLAPTGGSLDANTTDIYLFIAIEYNCELLYSTKRKLSSLIL